MGKCKGVDTGGVVGNKGVDTRGGCGQVQGCRH